MNEWKVGDRVYVTPDKAWTKGAQTALRGHGTIVEIKPQCQPDARYLVRFDMRPRPWHAHQTPSEAWHFGAAELTRVEHDRVSP